MVRLQVQKVLMAHATASTVINQEHCIVLLYKNPAASPGTGDLPVDTTIGYGVVTFVTTKVIKSPV